MIEGLCCSQGTLPKIVGPRRYRGTLRVRYDSTARRPPLARTAVVRAGRELGAQLPKSPPLRTPRYEAFPTFLPMEVGLPPSLFANSHVLSSAACGGPS